MPTDWRRLARKAGIPAEDAERIAAVLERLEADLRRIPAPKFDTQPATVFRP